MGVLARVPLASGLLTGKLTRRRTFAADDHRAFNRHGESFDVGETFAGLDYETGLAAGRGAARRSCPRAPRMAQLALRWILMFDARHGRHPGRPHAGAGRANAAAADLPPLPRRDDGRIRELYERYAKPLVHERW